MTCSHSGDEAHRPDTPPTSTPPSGDDLLAELENRQAALEQQNEQLKKTQIRLEDALRLFADLYDFAPMGYVTLDPACVTQRVNNTLAKLIGKPRSAIKGSPFLTYVDPDYRELFQAHVRHVLASETQRVLRCEIELQRDDEPPLAVLVESVPEIALDGGRYCRSAFVDISMKKEAERALRQRENQYKGIFESVTDGLLVFDFNGTIVEANPAACRMYGYAYDELIGMTGQQLLNPAHQDLFYETESQLRTGRTFQTESMDRRKDGSSFFVEVHNCFFQFRGRAHQLAVIRDITQRRKMEERLRESEERYRKITDEAPDPILLVDPENGEIEDINPAGRELFGLKKEQLIGRAQTDFFSRQQAELFRALFSRYQYEGSGEIFEAEFLSPVDGAVAPLEITARVIMLGRKRYLRQTLRDLRERRNAEQAQLAKSRLEASQTFATGIAHRINDLMVGVLGNAELLRMEGSSQKEDRQRLDDIITSAEQVGELAQEMLAFASRGETRMLATDLNRLIRESLRIITPVMKPGIRVALYLEDRLWPIQCDQGQMRQLLMNLVENALEAMGAKGTLSITTRNLDKDGHPLEDEARAPHRIGLTLEDTGCGMNEETVRRMFEPMFSLKGSKRGMGLAVAHGILQRHLADVQVRSRAGKGTTLTVQFAPADAREEQRREIQSDLAGDESVLIIDDDSITRQTLSVLLERLGYSVTLAADGQQALDLLEQGLRPDLTILDCKLPVVDSPTVLDRIRAESADTRVLLYSGSRKDDKAQELLERGAAAFLPKPSPLKDLVKLVRSILDR